MSKKYLSLLSLLAIVGCGSGEPQCTTFVPTRGLHPQTTTYYQERSDDLGATWRSPEPRIYDVPDIWWSLENAGLDPNKALELCGDSSGPVLTGRFSYPRVVPSRVDQNLVVDVSGGKIRFESHLFASEPEIFDYVGMRVQTFRFDILHTVVYTIRTGAYTYTARGETRATFAHPDGLVETDLIRYYGDSTGSFPVEPR